MLTLTADGAERFDVLLDAVGLATLASLADRVLDDAPGARLTGDPDLLALAGPGSTLQSLAARSLGPGAMAVRAVLFDKRADQNWSVGWHQDRTIVVKERREVEGFGTWSVKAGMLHVEPPDHILARMLTLRAHLDECDAENAPLLVSPGTHKLGRVLEVDLKTTIARHGIATCLADAGDVWVTSTPILHASEPAANPRRRRVLQVDFAAGDLPGGLEWRGIGQGIGSRQ